MDTIQKHAGGRPIEYDPSFPYLEKANEYLLTCGREQTKLPKVEEFCDFLDINDDTAVEWCKRYPNTQFSAAIKRIKTVQKGELIDDGLFGGKEVNASMAIFLLKANHGLIETSRTEVTGENGQPIQYKIITGTGYLPSSVIVDATPETDTAGGQSPVQNGSLAQKSP